MPKVTRFVPWKIIYGLPLVVLALLMPHLATAENFGILETIEDGLAMDSEMKLLEGVLRLVALNAVYSYPRYLGAFFLGASFVLTRNNHRLLWVNMIVVIAIVATINLVNGAYYTEQNSSILPLLAIPVLQLLLWSLDYPHVGILRRMPVMMMVLTGFQFINVMPAMEPLSLGRDGISVYVKQVLVEQGIGQQLNVLLLICAVACFGMGGLFLLFIHNENRLLEINALKAENTEILMNARMQELRNRSSWELKHLVHDLKTPLTSIQTLSYVVQMNQREDQEENRMYLRRIEGSVEHMSNMISEILYEDHRGAITTSALLNIVLAQLSASPYAKAVETDNRVPEATICVNSIRFARALINLVENSRHSQSERPLLVQITVDMVAQEGEDWVSIQVADNGVGIPAPRLEAIWTRGHSTQGSSGLGLPYVQETVESCGGTIYIKSQVNEGTQITIMLPRGELSTNERASDDSSH